MFKKLKSLASSLLKELEDKELIIMGRFHAVKNSLTADESEHDFLSSMLHADSAPVDSPSADKPTILATPSDSDSVPASNAASGSDESTTSTS